MEILFKKYFWLVKLAGLAAIVGFGSSASVTWVGAKYVLVENDSAAGDVDLDDDEDGTDETKAENKPARTGFGLVSTHGGSSRAAKTRRAGGIREDSIFCPTCAPLVEVVVEDGIVRPGEVKSALPLVLLATMESDNPMYSMATILDTETFALGPFSPQEIVRPDVMLERVERGRVVLRNGGQLEFLEVGGDIPKPKKTAKVATEKKKKKKKKKGKNYIEGSEEAISCGSEHNCTVERSFVEKLLANPASLAKQARVVPAVRDGETRGFKFYGIRPGSLPKLLGLKNGDLVTSVNGNELTSLDGAMALYSKLRRATHLSVTLERKGQSVNKEIDIQ